MWCRQVVRRADSEHAPGMHQRDPVAALGLVHEWVDRKIVTPSSRDRSIKVRQKLTRAIGSTQRSARPGSAAPDCRARRQRAADADGCRAADCQDGHRRRPASRTATASRPPASLVRKRANSRAGREGRGSAGRSARYRARSSVTYTRHCAASRCRWPPSAGRKA
jgi:hypothetical protein